MHAVLKIMYDGYIDSDYDHENKTELVEEDGTTEPDEEIYMTADEYYGDKILNHQQNENVTNHHIVALRQVDEVMDFEDY